MGFDCESSAIHRQPSFFFFLLRALQNPLNFRPSCSARALNQPALLGPGLVQVGFEAWLPGKSERCIIKVSLISDSQSPRNAFSQRKLPHLRENRRQSAHFHVSNPSLSLSLAGMASTRLKETPEEDKPSQYTVIISST